MVPPKSVKLTLRLPADLHAELVKQAALEHRSLNQQVTLFCRYGLKFQRRVAGYLARATKSDLDVL